MFATRSETLVFIGMEEQKLRYPPMPGTQTRLTGPSVNPVVYEQDTDYVLDAKAGTIRRTVNSRIPDWRSHPHYGKTSFDHRESDSYSNAGYTCTIAYTPVADSCELSDTNPLYTGLPGLRRKLAAGEPIRYVVFGDSISAGYEASRPELSYPERFASAMRARYPDAPIAVLNKAVGGESSVGGLKRLQHDVIALRPDLVTIAYGMNDQNRQPDGSNAVPVETFKRHLAEMAAGIQAQTDADILLVTPCLPNPRWMFASSNAAAYAEAIRSVGVELSLPVADVQQAWLEELAAGKSHESLLLNNLNHPNDYGHGVYAAVLARFLD